MFLILIIIVIIMFFITIIITTITNTMWVVFPKIPKVGSAFENAAP